MSAAEAQRHRYGPAWLKLLLILSLTGNLLVVGVIAGRELRESDQRVGGDRAVRWLVAMVPEERRAMAEAHFDEASETLAAAETERRALMEGVLTTIRAEPFEPAELQAAMAAFGESRAQRWVVLRERLATLLAEFTPAERAAFADNFEERMKRWRARRRE